MKKYILTLSLLAFATVCFSQTPASIGTYQIMTTNLKVGEVFSSEIRQVIADNRKQNEIVILKIGEYSWVRILSENTISNLNFTPLPDKIILIDGNDYIFKESVTITKTHN